MDTCRRLAVAIDDQSITAACVDPEGRLANRQSWPIERFNTLTDALMTFQRETGVSLLDTICALGVLGATEGDTIMLSRGNWAISRSGLRAIFGRDAIVINDVAARAWAAVGGPGTRSELLSQGAAMTAFDRPGRWALTKIDAGVGLAVIDIDEGGVVRVRECEMGHCGFAAVTAEERALAVALAQTPDRLISWEMVLTLGLDHAVWATPGLPLTRTARADLLARLAGRYVGDVALAHGAWAGAIVTGARAAELVSRATRGAFNGAFEHKPKFAKLIRATPRVLLTGQDMTLQGCAVALTRRAAPAPTVAMVASVEDRLRPALAQSPHRTAPPIIAYR